MDDDRGPSHVDSSSKKLFALVGKVLRSPSSSSSSKVRSDSSHRRSSISASLLLLPPFMDQGTATTAGTSLAGEIVWDVVLWRRGRADLSACLLATTVSSWLLFFGFGAAYYTLLSLTSTVLLLLLTVLFLWAKAARLLNRPEPPIPRIRVSRQAIDQAAALLHSGLNTLFTAFHDIALGKDSLLFCQVFLCLWIISILGSLTDFPTFCYICIVAVLTIPALYQKYRECVDRYMRFACMNLQMYETVYQRFSIKCLVSVRGWVIELLKDP